MSVVVVAAGLDDWLLFGHILAAMVWVGGGVVLGVLALRVVHVGDPDELTRFSAILGAIGPAVVESPRGEATSDQDRLRVRRVGARRPRRDVDVPVVRTAMGHRADPHRGVQGRPA